MPYIVYFDHSDATYNAGQASVGDNNGTWGYNDTEWFGLYLDENNQNGRDECLADWWAQSYQDVRGFHGGQGFLVAPGILPMRIDEPGSNNGSGLFMLIDHETVKNRIMQEWTHRTRSLPLMLTSSMKTVALLLVQLVMSLC